MITTSYYKTQEFKNLLKNLGLGRRDSQGETLKKREEFDDACLNLTRYKDLKIFKNVDPCQCFIDNEDKYLIDYRDIRTIVEKCIYKNELKLFTYLISNYPTKIFIYPGIELNLDWSYQGDMDDWKYFDIFSDIDSVEFIKSMENNIRKDFRKRLREFIDIIFKNNLKWENCDVIQHFVDNYNLKDILSFIGNYLENLFKNEDILMIIMKKFPNFFDNFEDWSLYVEDDEMIDIFVNYNALAKIKPLPFLASKKDRKYFLYEYRFEFKLYDFISSIKYSSIFCYVEELLGIINLLRDFTDHESIFCKFEAHGIQRYSNIISEIRSNRIT